MPDNHSNNSRQGNSNAAVSNQSPDNIDVWRLKITDNQEHGEAQSSPLPDRPGEPDCGYYLRTGSCGYGSNCRFNHPTYAVPVAQGPHITEELPERVGQPDCGYYLRTGTCKYGSTCKYNHPKDRNGAAPVSFNLVGLPMRQDEKSCPYYLRTGACKFGVACKFHHPQPKSFGTGSTLAGTAVLGPTGSPIVSSSSTPYAGGLSPWSLPRATYMPSPRLQGPQTYMPVVLPSHQGIGPAPGWSTYVGSLGPISSVGVVGSNLAYDSRNQGESVPNGQLHLLPASSPELPQRPDQPECRHFLNTGTCKYGSDCKYHHPKERMAQLTTNMLGPPWLPSRPGQPVCSNYSSYGVCKYGPNCRFDHPFLAYPYSYSVSLPPLLDSSLITYPRMMPTAFSYETAFSPPSKHSDWVQNSNTANEHQSPDTNTKSSDDPSEQAGHRAQHSSQDSSEPPSN